MSARPTARARREEARRLADLLKVDELADNPYVTRAVLMVAGTPVKAAVRLAELRALLAETHEGDVGWEAEELAYAKALEAADRCACCGRAISADDSLEAGLGRTCRDNLATRLEVDAHRAGDEELTELVEVPGTAQVAGGVGLLVHPATAEAIERARAARS